MSHMLQFSNRNKSCKKAVKLATMVTLKPRFYQRDTFSKYIPAYSQEENITL